MPCERRKRRQPPHRPAPRSLLRAQLTKRASIAGGLAEERLVLREAAGEKCRRQLLGSAQERIGRRGRGVEPPHEPDPLDLAPYRPQLLVRRAIGRNAAA